MKLVYLYIGYMNRPLDYCQIPFSNDFKISFNRKNKKLSISRNSEKKSSIYGKNIHDLKLLVGKNGCGKSTILNLLGLSPHDMRREFIQYKDENHPVQEDAYDWFLLYHLDGDLFALEGYNPSIIQQSGGYFLQNHYSVSFRYDYPTGDLYDIGLLQETKDNETGYTYISKASYLFYSLEPNVTWYSNIKRQRYERYETIFFTRYDISQFNYSGLEHFLYLAAKKDEHFKRLFDNNPAALKVEICLHDPAISHLTLSAQQTIMAKAIYGENGKFLSMPMPELEKSFGLSRELSYKHSMVIRYLEELLVNSLNSQPVQNKNLFHSTGGSENEKYLSRKRFLLNFMEDLTRIPGSEDSYQDSVIHPDDLQLAKQFCAALEQVPDRFFKSGHKAVIPLQECDTNFLEPLMECYDLNLENDEHGINHHGVLSFNIQNLSTGELSLIDLYAAILNGIRKVPKNTNIILLLDEPDSRLHPEWSRLFLKRLLELLRQDPFSDYEFQIIIATHSPLLLSDVINKDIICLEQSENKVKITNANHGFMSNLNEILLDGMFLSSPFGAFAEDYTNRLISRINELRDGIQNNSYRPDNNGEDEFSRLEEQINIIGEPYLKKSLEHSLNQLRSLYSSQLSRKERIEYLKKELERLSND